jgi:hypothetical protein
MNRLILVGNGFDLAHDRATSYSDFLIDHLFRAFTNSSISYPYDDGLIKITCSKIENNGLFSTFKDVRSMIDHFKETGGFMFLKNRQIALGDDGNIYHVLYSVEYSELLAKTLECFDKLRWVDIEEKYFELLSETLKEDYKKPEKKLKGINNQLSLMTNFFASYLRGLQPFQFHKEIERKIFEPAKEDDFVEQIKVKNPSQKGPDDRHGYLKDGEIKINDIKIINFNYTNTIGLYIEELTKAGRSGCPEIINIHGTLSPDDNNPLIFGFGDERHDDYKLMEKSRTKGWFDHIKSLAYLRTRDYSDLVRFIEVGQFQVYIFGHSCGLSDRTLLSMIFEHRYCKSIKIFYKPDEKKDENTDEIIDFYRKTTEEISRQFTDKIKMRNRVVAKELCEPLIKQDI